MRPCGFESRFEHKKNRPPTAADFFCAIPALAVEEEGVDGVGAGGGGGAEEGVGAGEGAAAGGALGGGFLGYVCDFEEDGAEVGGVNAESVGNRQILGEIGGDLAGGGLDEGDVSLGGDVKAQGHPGDDEQQGRNDEESAVFGDDAVHESANSSWF